MRKRAALAALVLVAACDDRVDTCRDPLGGIWEGPGLVLHLLDRGATVEAYAIDGDPAFTAGGAAADGDPAGHRTQRAADAAGRAAADGDPAGHRTQRAADAAGQPTTRDAVLVAPALLDLSRRGDELVGTELRRYARGAHTCAMRGPARLHGCRDGRAVLDVTPAGAPTDWTLCTPASSAPRTIALTRR